MRTRLLLVLSCGVLVAVVPLGMEACRRPPASSDGPETRAEPRPNCDDWPTAAFLFAATTAEVAACLDAGAAPTAVPLREAMLARNVDAVEILLAAGADAMETLIAEEAEPDRRTPWTLHEPGGHAPLHFAASDNPAMVRVLLAAGAEVDVRDLDGYTPLHYARGQYAAAVAMLLTAGADVNARSNSGLTPLHTVHPPEPASVELLLAMGADVNARSESGLTPLHTVSDGQDEPLSVDALAADYFYGGVASSSERTAIELLLAAGADVNARTEDGATPLHYAAMNDRAPDVLLPLLAAGADVRARDHRNRTPLHWAAWCRPRRNPSDRCSNVGAFEVLLAAGADATIRHEDGSTLLHAVGHIADFLQEEYRPVEVLIAAGLDVNAKDALGLTPLDRAVEHSTWTANTGTTTAMREAGGVAGMVGVEPLRGFRGVVVEVLLAAWAAVAGTQEERSPTSAAVEASLGLSQHERRAVEHGLWNSGFNPGARDGVFDLQTRRAIFLWQWWRVEHGPRTGYLNATQGAALQEIGPPGGVQDGRGCRAPRFTRVRP